MVEIISVSLYDLNWALERAAEIVKSEGVLIYPTDTLYGIGGTAISSKVAERVHKIKGTEPDKPMSVVMADINMIERYCRVDDWQRMVLEKNLPGPFTFLLPLKVNLPVSSNNKLGVRIPDSSFSHRLSDITNVPIITSSANSAGKKPPSRLEEIDGKILSAVDVAIDIGVTRYHEASAVVDLVEKKILRKGAWEIELFGY
jgi:L-threonylcarbamoyladenylate synthase